MTHLLRIYLNFWVLVLRNTLQPYCILNHDMDIRNLEMSYTMEPYNQDGHTFDKRRLIHQQLLIRQ